MVRQSGKETVIVNLNAGRDEPNRIQVNDNQSATQRKHGEMRKWPGMVVSPVNKSIWCGHTCSLTQTARHTDNNKLEKRGGGTGLDRDSQRTRTMGDATPLHNLNMFH